MPDIPPVTPDQGTPFIPTENVLYVTGSSSSKLTAYTIKTDGTGKKAVPGLTTAFDIEAIVFGTGTSSSSSGFNLQVKSIYGGAAKVLDSTAGYTHVMAVYK